MTAPALAEALTGSLRATVNRDDLLRALRHVSLALPHRPAVPVLAGVLLEGTTHGSLVVSAYDYETSATASLLSPDARGRALLSGRLLTEMVTVLPKGVELTFTTSASGNRVVVETFPFPDEQVRYELPTLPVEDYPQLPELDRQKARRVNRNPLSSRLLADLLEPCFLAAGKDDTLPVLTGVRIEPNGGNALTVAATDRYRLAVQELDDVETDLDAPVLVPAKGLANALRSLKRSDSQITMWVSGLTGGRGDALLVVEAGWATWSTRLLDGEFPKYRTLIPSDFGYTITCDPDRLREAIRRVAITAPRNAPVRLDKEGDHLLLAAGASEDAQARGTLPASFTGETVGTFAGNPGYVIDGLAPFRGKPNVTVSLTSNTRPMVWTSPERPGLTYLLMPVRLAG